MYCRNPIAVATEKLKKIDELFAKSTAVRPVMDGPFTVFVGNLDPKETEQTVALAFNAFGTIVGRVKILMRKYCKIAFITYTTQTEMEFAVNSKDGRSLYSGDWIQRPLTVQIAKPKPYLSKPLVEM